ncbi:U6 snRNA-associated Sm-like protein LSm1 [Octopus bimaculoides]|uniref:U6 snRNA-associated Sm-like protein LSm1 n=1 Tax=Octopus bimaculoides TaxID=37653 RepID=A0A0L8FUQ8_OCTBM|nr:U6 snRNA-associated Sm-like protein LSm1 [Octopus bimaculoides]|eukprot:XP_014786961.1 PREDICTED: U6 snRNA-associated Sm-like protein LSm1 [Octopus bimaculoides]
MLVLQDVSRWRYVRGPGTDSVVGEKRTEAAAAEAATSSAFLYLEMSYLPGTASLVEEIDKKLLVVLRDGRTLIGFLRSVDQFANLALHRTIERIHVGKKYGDIPRGIFIIRGENVVLLGEIDVENENSQDLEQVSIDEILEMQREQQLRQLEEEERKKKALLERGVHPHTDSIQDDYFF